jgi:hypothetical protein
VPTIRDLDGRRSPLACAKRVGTGTISCDYLDPRTGFQPRRQGLRLAVGEKIHDCLPFQVTQDRAVAAALAESPIVDAQDARGRQLVDCCVTDAPQQCIRAGRHRQARSESRTRLSAESETNLTVCIMKPYCRARVRRSDLWQAFHKYLSGALGRHAEETPTAKG